MSLTAAEERFTRFDKARLTRKKVPVFLSVAPVDPLAKRQLTVTYVSDADQGTDFPFDDLNVAFYSQHSGETLCVDHLTVNTGEAAMTADELDAYPQWQSVNGHVLKTTYKVDAHHKGGDGWKKFVVRAIARNALSRLQWATTGSIARYDGLGSDIPSLDHVIYVDERLLGKLGLTVQQVRVLMNPTVTDAYLVLPWPSPDGTSPPALLRQRRMPKTFLARDGTRFMGWARGMVQMAHNTNVQAVLYKHLLALTTNLNQFVTKTETVEAYNAVTELENELEALKQQYSDSILEVLDTVPNVTQEQKDNVNELIRAAVENPDNVGEFNSVIDDVLSVSVDGLTTEYNQAQAKRADLEAALQDANDEIDRIKGLGAALKDIQRTGLALDRERASLEQAIVAEDAKLKALDADDARDEAQLAKAEQAYETEISRLETQRTDIQKERDVLEEQFRAVECPDETSTPFYPGTEQDAATASPYSQAYTASRARKTIPELVADFEVLDTAVTQQSLIYTALSDANDILQKLPDAALESYESVVGTISNKFLTLKGQVTELPAVAAIISAEFKRLFQAVPSTERFQELIREAKGYLNGLALEEQDEQEGLDALMVLFEKAFDESLDIDTLYNILLELGQRIQFIINNETFMLPIGEFANPQPAIIPDVPIETMLNRSLNVLLQFYQSIPTKDQFETAFETAKTALEEAMPVAFQELVARKRRRYDFSKEHFWYRITHASHIVDDSDNMITRTEREIRTVPGGVLATGRNKEKRDRLVRKLKRLQQERIDAYNEYICLYRFFDPELFSLTDKFQVTLKEESAAKEEWVAQQELYRAKQDARNPERERVQTTRDGFQAEINEIQEKVVNVPDVPKEVNSPKKRELLNTLYSSLLNEQKDISDEIQANANRIADIDVLLQTAEQRQKRVIQIKEDVLNLQRVSREERTAEGLRRREYNKLKLETPKFAQPVFDLAEGWIVGMFAALVATPPPLYSQRFNPTSTTDAVTQIERFRRIQIDSNVDIWREQRIGSSP